MRVLVTGAGGQLGRAVLATAPASAVLRGATRAELDIADAAALESVFRDFAPELVINAAAFTRVDDAEGAPERAARANSTGPLTLAQACRGARAWLTHVSSDFVFDGRQGHPYAPEAQPNPLSVYGRTKLDGERAIRSELPHQSAIVRSSWLYSAEGGFLARMLPLMRTRPQLSIVSDQVAVPTNALGLAEVLWAISARRASGLWHWCDSGVASWYDFAVAIAEEAVHLRVLASAPAITAIGTAEYPTAATRPAFSLLDKRATERLLDRRAPHWRSALRAILGSMQAGGTPGEAPAHGRGMA